MTNHTVSLSIVIASAAGGDFLRRCLDSLREQVIEHGAELIVVDRCGGDFFDRLQREYSFATVIRAELDHKPSVPELRALGVLHASGDIVGIIEEHCIAPPTWIETIFNSFDKDDAAIGGPILDNNFERQRDWVVYFSEYHNYLPPWKECERYLLNGANIAYNRKLLLRHSDVLSQGYWEVVLHPILFKEGPFRSVPSMGVYHTGPFDYLYYLEQRYLLSRAWAGTQRDRVSFSKRLLYLIAAPLLPIFLFVRITRRVLSSKQLVGRYICIIPLLVPVLIVYAVGEWLGYYSGVGDALERVE